MKELIFVVEESSEGGFEAEALGEGIVTEADTLEDLRKNVAEAVQAHFDEQEMPHVVRLHFVREELLAV